DTLAEARHALVPVVAGDVQEVVGGILDGLYHLRVRMAGAAHGDAGGEIEEAVAVDVPDLHATAPGHDEGVVTRIGGRADRAVALEERAGLGSGQLGADVGWMHG